MEKLGIHTGKELKSYSLQFLLRNFGKSGIHYFNIVRGIHNSPVQPQRIRKSISAENTFENDLKTSKEYKEHLHPIYEELCRRLEKGGINGRTITLKIKFSDFSQQTRSKTLDRYPDKTILWKSVLELLFQEEISKGVRLFGLGLSNLNTSENQSIFDNQLKIPF